MSDDKFGITIADRDRVWGEVQGALYEQKNQDILSVIFDDHDDTPSTDKIKMILRVLKRYDEVLNDWDLKLHNGKTAKQEAKERSEQIRKALGFDDDFNDIFKSNNPFS